VGNYASTTELVARFKNTTEVEHLAGSPSTDTAYTAVLNEVIDGAEGDIDSAAAGLYEVPLDVAGDAVMAAYVKSMTLDIAVGSLFDRGRNVPVAIELARTRRMEWLDKLSEGKRWLPSARTEATTVSRAPDAAWGIASESDDSQRVFSRKTQEAL
jgi:phage gp36-like protein